MSSMGIGEPAAMPVLVSGTSASRHPACVLLPEMRPELRLSLGGRLLNFVQQAQEVRRDAMQGDALLLQ